MPEDHSHHHACTVKVLPEELRVEAARRAIQINPANAPAREMIAAAAPGHLPSPAHLALLTSSYWGAGGVRLTVGFMDNPPADLRKRILSHMNAWGKWSNVHFTETNTNPQVRIARQGGKDGGYWSHVGTDILSVPAGQPTMNLEAFTMNTSDSEFYRVVRHETGHTLGFPHEHLRKSVVDRIDRNKALAYFKLHDNWDAATTEFNVLTAIPDSALNATSTTDLHSIMCYWLPAEIMKDGKEVPGGLDVDALDAMFASTVYPTASSKATSIWPNGKAYFFKGPQYLRYDPVADKTDAGYPKPIAGNWPGVPASFASGIDAAIAWNNGKAYLFKGANYLRYDIAGDKVDAGYPKSIASNWSGLAGAKIDAVMRWPNGKAYFFSGSKYFRYDIAKDKVDPGYPKAIAGNWAGLPAEFTAGINAATTWNNGKTYFFKNDKYVRYDIAADKADAGYPKPIAGNWPGFWPSDVDA
jgi:hypothetical protein